MLTLVHPPTGGNGGPTPTRRRKGIPARSLSLTPDEARHLRASIRNLARVRYGTLRKLADALGVDRDILTRRKHPGPALAVAMWRLTGVSVEALLGGKLAAVPSGEGGP